MLPNNITARLHEFFFICWISNNYVWWVNWDIRGGLLDAWGARPLIKEGGGGHDGFNPKHQSDQVDTVAQKIWIQIFPKASTVLNFDAIYWAWNVLIQIYSDDSDSEKYLPLKKKFNGRFLN